MNRTIRLCALAGSDGIAIPAPFVDVRRRGLFSSRVPSLSEKGTCSRSELEAFSLSRTAVINYAVTQRGFKSAFEWSPVDRVDR